MDDNVWEYPFGDLEDDDDMFFRHQKILLLGSPITRP